MTHHGQDRARKAAGEAAAALVEPGMIVGLGTGDTAAHFIGALATRRLANLRCVPTSLRSAELALNLGLPLIELDLLPGIGKPIDLTVDGADEIDPSLRLIKGAGGALLREKLIAAASCRLVIVADEGKVVTSLGEKRLLPVEIVPYGVPQTVARLQSAFAGAQLRMVSGQPVKTDGGNHLLDVPLERGSDPDRLHKRLKEFLGVIETGLFLSEADHCLIGTADGSVLKKMRESKQAQQ